MAFTEQDLRELHQTVKNGVFEAGKEIQKEIKVDIAASIATHQESCPHGKSLNCKLAFFTGAWSVIMLVVGFIGWLLGLKSNG